MINFNEIFGLMWMGYKNNPLIKRNLLLLKESNGYFVALGDF